MSIVDQSPRPQRVGAPQSLLTARRIATVLFLAAVLVLWQVYSAYMPPVLIPSPHRVLIRFGELLSGNGYLPYALMSLFHVVASVLIAFTLGVSIAFVGHYYAIFELAIFSRLSPFLNSFSGIGWAFLALIWFGVDDRAVIFATSVALLPFAIINAGAGLRELNLEIMEMGMSFSRSNARQIYRIILPMMFPYLFATIRLCFGIGWQIVLFAELLCGSSGLGTIINLARLRFWTDMVFAVALLVLAVVYFMDRIVFAAIERRLRSRYELS
jgi:ABC-type nitrate/sulfonate/bicarbonate transport system permease component